MNGVAWNPPAAAALILGLAALASWLWLAPPPRSMRGVLRVMAALFLVLALFDVGCRHDEGAAPRVVVLVDRSFSMQAGDRDDAARAWLERLDPALEGWRVERDSFGRGTTDLAAAIARTEARLPDAIVVVSDGRAAGGRAAEPGAVPLYVYIPHPLDVEDLAVVDVVVEEEERGAIARVEVAAVGGLPASGRDVTVRLGGVVVGRATISRLAAGERRTVTVRLPAGRNGEVVEAVLEGNDAVEGNDRRARVLGPGSGARAALLVALRPGWEFGFVRRALADVAPVEAYWAPTPGTMAPLDRSGEEAWSSLSPERYRTVWLFGDPALLGESGRAWIERFARIGGRGVLWAPAGYAGRLPGVGVVLAAGTRRTAVPELTEAGARWLVAHGGRGAGESSGGVSPEGSGAWPPLELLPVAPPDPGPGSTSLLVAADRPVAWIAERPAGRAAVLLGTGYYRWRLGAEEGPRAFWDVWIVTLARWLAGAASAERPLVRMPTGGRVSFGDTLIAPVLASGELEWRVEHGGELVAQGRIEADAEERMVRAGPFDPGIYRLTVDPVGPARSVSETFAAETWAPDLSGTAADTASLGQAARASGGARLGDDPRLPRPVHGIEATAGPRAFGWGTTPWAYITAALLLLVDWGLGRRSR